MDERITVPPFVWGYGISLLSLLLAFIVFLLFQWIVLVGYILLLIGGVFGAVCLSDRGHKSYHNHKKMIIDRQTAKNKVIILEEKVKEAKLKNQVLEQMPDLIRIGIQNGMNVSYNGLSLTNWRSNVHTISREDIEIKEIDPPKTVLPTLVKYEEIRTQIPSGHNLVGISGEGLITKEDKHIGACVWIIGGSGSGKTSTTSLRLEERAACGHSFYGVDPHWFKDDSLTNAVVGFSERFLLPMARDTVETKLVLETFLKEFQDRKAGLVEKPFRKITLVVDEVGSLNDPQNEDEEEVLKLLKTITRICGQESRNFNMGGIFISQQATGLYWIGNVALLIIVHKLIKENQQKLATNVDDKKLFAEMRVWPKGRTYVYGMGLEEGEGCIVLQQPFFEKEQKGVWNWLDKKETIIVEQESERDRAIRIKSHLSSNGLPDGYRDIASLMGCGKDKVAKLLRE